MASLDSTVSDEAAHLQDIKKMRDIILLLRNKSSTKFQECLDFLAFSLRYRDLSYSQILQDIMVIYETNQKRNGYFVEFGVCDGIEASNTYLLEKTLDWSGIVAEPSKAWQTALLQNRSCLISKKCVYNRSGSLISFNQTDNPGLATIDEYSQSDGHSSLRAEGTKYPVETITLSDLLKWAKSPYNIDYLSIDTEGSEFDILDGFDFTEYDIKIITVEHNYQQKNRDNLYSLLIKNGYTRKYVAISEFDDWYFKDQ